MASVIKIGDKWRAQVRRRHHKAETKTFRTKREADEWARVGGAFRRTAAGEGEAGEDAEDERDEDEGEAEFHERRRAEE